MVVAALHSSDFDSNCATLYRIELSNAITVSATLYLPLRAAKIENPSSKTVFVLWILFPPENFWITMPLSYRGYDIFSIFAEEKSLQYVLSSSATLRLTTIE